jgi:RING-like zinc finger
MNNIKETGANSVLVRACNEQIYGSFSIPNAIGFSTPVSLVIDGVISLCHDAQLPRDAFIKEYEKWSGIYGGSPIRNLSPITLTADHITCSICTEDYKLGEKIFILDCKHQFHWDCISKWIVQNCNICKMFQNSTNIATHNSHNAFSIVSEKSADCSLCRSNTNM